MLGVWRICTSHENLTTVLTIAQHEGCWKELEQYGVSSVWSHTEYLSLLSQQGATPGHGSHTWARCEKLSEWQHSLLPDGPGSHMKQPVLHWYHSPLINDQINILLILRNFWYVNYSSIFINQTTYYCVNIWPASRPEWVTILEEHDGGRTPLRSVVD